MGKLAIVALIALVLAACGRTGPLYLPGKTTAASPAQPAASPNPQQQSR